mgnify:CR=1 FL=1
MSIRFHRNDLPDLSRYDVEAVAIDTETLGLKPHRDRLCVVQMSGGDGHSHIVQIEKGQTEAPNLCAMLTDAKVLKLFHFGRFDNGLRYAWANNPVCNFYNKERNCNSKHIHVDNRRWN